MTKFILAVIIINLKNVLTNVFSIRIPLVIKGEFSENGVVILQFSSYIQKNVKEVTIYNIMINGLMAVIFYLMTEKIIEEKVQL